MNRRPFLPALLLAGLAAAFLASAAAAQGGRLAPDAAVARVGTQPVTRAALLRHLERYDGRAALEQLVQRALLEQDAALYKIQLKPAEIDGRVEEARKAAGVNLDAALQAEGISEDAWKERLRYGLLAEKVLDRKWPVKDSDLERLTLRYARFQTERQARAAIAEARSTPFDILVLRDSLDKENAGLILPEKFLRVERPDWFKRGEDLRPGQVSRTPIPSGQFFLVVKLEGRYPPSTLKPKEREQAEARVRAYRMAFLMPALRKRWKVQEKLDPAALPEKTAPDALIATVGSAEISRADLTEHLLEYFGKAALEQLIERTVITQEAARAGVSVSEAEIAARAAEIKKGGADAFAGTLKAEGITEEAWKERLRYTLLAEKVVGAKSPVVPDELVRLTARFIRVGTEKEAQQVVQALRMGASVEQVMARLGTKGREGFIQPKAFLRVDNPSLYKKFEDARVPNGQVLPEPVELGGAWLALKLEARFGPETLTAKERDDAVRRINASRAAEVLDGIRKTYKIEYPVPMKTLIEDASAG